MPIKPSNLMALYLTVSGLNNPYLKYIFHGPKDVQAIEAGATALKSHPTDSNLRPLVYKASGLFTTPERLHI